MIFTQEFNTLHHTYPFSQIRTEDYLPAFREAMRQENDEIEAIVQNPDPATFANTIEAYERCGRMMNRVQGVFGNLCGSDMTDEMQAIEETITPELSEHGNAILFNKKLFSRIKTVYDQREQLGLNGEQMRLLEEIYEGFARNGALLSDEEMDRMRAINKELSMLAVRFSNNVLKETNAWKLHITDEEELSGVPENTKQMLAEKAKAAGKEGYLLDLQPTTYGPVMRYADSSELRHTIWLAHASRCSQGGKFDNKEIVRSIVNLRLEKGRILGHKSFAALHLQKRMAKSPAGVFALLDKLCEAYHPVAEKEFAELCAYAKKKGVEGELERWDMGYWGEKMRQELYQFNSEELRPYFELSQVIKGVFGLAEKLYGIKFKPCSNIETYHPEVQAFEVFDKDDTFLAVLYTDFHPRETKRGGAWMSEFRGQWVEDGEDHRPHIVIVMNFTKPLSDKPALLTLGEVNTFLHEFGHALHGMLTRCHYEALSGTNVARDFVELPSQLMENFTTEREFLNTFAYHYETHEPIPDELLERIHKAQNYQAGTACCGQLAYAYLDMAWHSLETAYERDVVAFEDKATEKTRIVPKKKTDPQLFVSSTFNHLFSGGYAAGYYSYKWSEVLDADAFELFKELGIFSQEAAGRFRKEILERGNQCPADELYRNFRGRDAKIDALMRRDGIK